MNHQVASWEPLQKLLSLCKCGVHITVNPHKDYHQTPWEYVKDVLERTKEEIPVTVFGGMMEFETVVEVQAYPDTPLGFYRVLHYDLDAAIQETIDSILQGRPK